MSSYYNITAKKNSKEYHEYIIELNNKKKEDAKKIKMRLSDKIFDVLEKDGENYFLDKELNLIWDENTNVVGIINDKKYIFLKDEKAMINNILDDNIKVKKIISEIKYSLV
jgi:hypothetical protein